MRMESFIKFPRGLLELPEFSGMSVEAKLLFALILDRTGVSEMNSGRFTDKQGNLFVIYTLDEICGKLGCSKPTAVKALKELQEREMIEKKREGAGKASKIIVKKSVLSVLKILPDSSKKFNPSGKENEPDEVKNSAPPQRRSSKSARNRSTPRRSPSSAVLRPQTPLKSPPTSQTSPPSVVNRAVERSNAPSRNAGSATGRNDAANAAATSANAAKPSRPSAIRGNFSIV